MSDGMRKPPHFRYRGWTAIIWMCACFPALGQDNKDDIIQKLISRVEALEREVAALKQASAPEPVAAMPQPEPVPPAAVIAAAAIAPDVSEPMPVTESRFAFHGYADVDFLRNPDGSSIREFEVGELDLFATARITPKLTALVEAVLEEDNQVYIGSVPINLERVLLQYKPSEFFNLDIGSYRTAIGYYNTAYLRGAWFQTALTRPTLFTFEDDGGFLPLHNTGVSANGLLPSGGLGLQYVVEAGNSRNYAGARPEFDITQHSAFNLALLARPHAWPGFETGFSYYHDLYAPVQGLTADRSVWTAHAVYQANRFEFLNEVVLVKFQRPDTGWGKAQGFYSQLAYRIGSSWSPYFRVEDLNSYGRGLLGSTVVELVPWRTIITGGLRYDLNEAVALKFELGRDNRVGQPAWVQAGMQVAFTF
jgi:hypothetical protein